MHPIGSNYNMAEEEEQAAISPRVLTITEVYESQDEFRTLLARLNFPVANINRLAGPERIQSAKILSRTRLKDLETSLNNVNRLFGNQRVNNQRIYFAGDMIVQLKALAAYFKRANDANRIPDIRLINLDVLNGYVLSLDNWLDSPGDVKDVVKQETIKFESDKFVKFREKILTLISSIKGVRGIYLDYLTRPEGNDNEELIEDPSPDVNSLEFMRLNTTHSGPEYAKDNHDLYTLLRHFLTGTPGWNVIAKYKRANDGRRAYHALRAHYEGKSFFDSIKSKANQNMTKTFYRGDTPKFSWEKFVEIHLEAHRMFEDVGEPLTDSMKILHFKSGIRPEAGLESALDVARGLPHVMESFDSYVNHVTEGVTNRRTRQEAFKNSNTRDVHAVHRSGRGRGNFGGRGYFKGGRSRGRGRGRGRGRFNRGGGRYHRLSSNIPRQITVEGVTLYPSKGYPPEEYDALSINQKRELRNARLGRYDEGSNNEDARSIKAAIVQGFRNLNQCDNAADDGPNESGQNSRNDQENNASTSSTITSQLRKRRRPL